MIHREEIAALLCALYEASGFRLSLHDATTREIAAYPAVPSLFCSAVHACALRPSCVECDAAAFAEAKKAGRIYVYRCHMGLYEAISPIYQDGALQGFLMMGQVLGEGDSFAYPQTAGINSFGQCKIPQCGKHCLFRGSGSTVGGFLLPETGDRFQQDIYLFCLHDHRQRFIGFYGRQTGKGIVRALVFALHKTEK